MTSFTGLKGLRCSLLQVVGIQFMLGALFLFYGRTGRLQYFLWSAIFVPLALFAAWLLLCLTPVFGGGEPSFALSFFAIVGLPLVIFLWAEFSLQATRVRDIGWRPGIIIPALIAINLVNVLLDYVVGIKTFDIVFYAINIIATLVFQFTPSDAGDMFPPFATPRGAPQGQDASGRRSPAAPAAVNRQSSPQSFGQRRPTYPGEKVPFGRRGLT